MWRRTGISNPILYTSSAICRGKVVLGRPQGNPSVYPTPLFTYVINNVIWHFVWIKRKASKTCLHLIINYNRTDWLVFCFNWISFDTLMQINHNETKNHPHLFGQICFKMHYNWRLLNLDKKEETELKSRFHIHVYTTFSYPAVTEICICSCKSSRIVSTSLLICCSLAAKAKQRDVVPYLFAFRRGTRLIILRYTV